MFQKLRLGLLAFLLYHLIACSTFSREQCEQMDWSARGYESALRGETPVSDMGFYKRECEEEHGVKLDQDRYNEGYKQGLDRFCTKDGGFSFARNGGYYRGICPKEKEPQFLERFSEGRMIFLENRVSSLSEENKRLKSDLERTQRDLDSARQDALNCRSKSIH